MGLRFNQKVMGYSCSIHKTIASLCVSSQASCNFQTSQMGEIGDYFSPPIVDVQLFES